MGGKTQTKWGNHQVVRSGEDYKIKILTVDPGGMLSLQHHAKRIETWHVLEGKGLFFLYDAGLALKDQETITRIGPQHILNIDKKQMHRVINDWDVPLIILEIQRGDCDEGDIERIIDIYGRADD